MTQAQALGITEDQLERLAIQYENDQQLLNELEALIDEQQRTAGAAPAETQQPTRPTAEPAPAEPGTTDTDGNTRAALEAEIIRRDAGVLSMATPRQARQEVDVLANRKARLAQMSMDELVDAIYTDPLTGIANLKAYQEEARYYPIKAVVDGDSLKWVNDNLGMEAGDAMLIAIGQALDQADVAAYRIGGDEFVVMGDSAPQVQAALELAHGILANQAIESPKGRVEGIRITHALGKTKAQADGRMKAEKARKEGRGERAARGEAPPNATLSIKRNRVLNAGPGTNYVPIIGKRGRLPIDAKHNLRLGNGRIVKIPNVPVRREHILAVMRRYFGNRIYEGRIKSNRLALGFYRPGQGELRLKHHNDIEVAAHEIAHFLDDRYPWIANLYKQHRDEMLGVSYDTDLIFEGYAEFMRLWFTQETFAMERAPGFYDAWMKELDNHPKLKGMVFDLQELMHAWTMQGARARGASRVGRVQPSMWERFTSMSDWWDRFLQGALDKLRRIKLIEADLGGEPEAYMKFRLATGGSNSMLEATFLWGTPGKRADGQGYEFTGDGLLKIFGDYWGDEDFGYYMIARRAQELEAAGKSSGFRSDEIAEFLKYENANPEAARIFEEYQAFNERMLDFAIQTGILSVEAKDKMLEAYNNYVPFHRVIEGRVNNKPVQPGGNPFQRLKGSERNVNIVWDNIMNQTGLIIRSGLLNDAKRTLLKKLSGTDRLGAGRRNQQAGVYAAPIGPDSRPVSITGDQVLKAALEAMGWTMADYKLAKEGFLPANMEAEEAIAQINQIETMAANMKDFVTFWEVNLAPTGNVDSYSEDGKRYYFEINDPMLWDSLTALGPKPANMILQILGGFSATLRRGVVSLPVFQTKNFVRDTLNAWMLSSNVKVPAARAMRQIVKKLDQDPHYQEMVLNGGGFANRLQGLEVQRKLFINPADMVAKYDRIMSRFENANRLAEYEAAIEAGEGPARAALLSRDISTDFAMRGSSEIARILAISVPFLNARAQGLYRVGRVTNDTQQLRSFATRGMMLAGATLALYALNKDDDRYEEFPEDIRDLYWIIFTGEGEDDYVLIPKPFESGMLWGTIPERIFEYTIKRDGEEFTDAMLWMFLQTFNMDMTPQVFQPWRDLDRNKNFTGAPIIPFGLENVEPSEQFSYYTSETAIRVGQKMGVSPIKLEYLYRGYLGTLGTWSLAASDAMIRAATDPWVDPVTGEEFPEGQYGPRVSRGETWKENVVVKGVADWMVNEGPPRRTKYKTDLYDMVREAEEVARSIASKQARQAEDTEQYLRDNEFIVGVTPELMTAKQELTRIRRGLEAIRTDRNLTEDEKRVEAWNLTRLQNEVARETMLAIRQAEIEYVEELERQEAEAAAQQQRAAGAQ